MKRSRLVILLAVATIAAGTGWWFWQSRPARDDGAVFYGNVDIREVNLGFRVSGRVEKMLKDEGDLVKAGEIIALLDPEPFQHQLDKAKANLNALIATRDLRRNGNRVEDISKAAAAVTELRATSRNAGIELARQKKLLATNVSSRREYDNAEVQYHEAAARTHSAQENLRQLQSGFRVEEIAEAEANVAKAQAEVKAAETNLIDTKLIAPEDGIVMTRAVEAGSIMQAGSTALTVNLRAPVWVRAYVNEPFLARVKPGSPVELYTDFHPTKPYHGQIGYVSPRAEFTPKSVETTDLRTALVYRFRVVVSAPDDNLRQGMPVTVRLASE
jgi:HlyD family secretion protein